MKFLLPLIILLASTFAFAQDASVISTTANLRGTPSLKGVKITALPKDTSMRILGSDGTWYLVQTPEYIGWMYYKLIKVDGTRKPREITLFQKGTISGGNTLLRGTASENGEETVFLRNNTRFDIYGKARGWHLIQTPTYAGWVRSEFVREIKPRTTTLPTSKTGRTIFQTQSVDRERNPRVRIRNNANRTLILTFGGVKYIIKPKRGRILELNEGRYRYTAAGGGATPYTRIENFQKGKVYAVAFRINKTTRRR